MKEYATMFDAPRNIDPSSVALKSCDVLHVVTIKTLVNCCDIGED